MYFTWYIDVDECKRVTSRCSHKCHNTDGGFLCSCYDGYILDLNGFTCTTGRLHNTQNINKYT